MQGGGGGGEGEERQGGGKKEREKRGRERRARRVGGGGRGILNPNHGNPRDGRRGWGANGGTQKRPLDHPHNGNARPTRPWRWHNTNIRV